MAVKRKTLRFLPGVFRTDVNRKFLGSTLDQLINEPELRKIDGYIGRNFSPTYSVKDSQIVEASPGRQYYQLEPSIIVKNDLEQVENFTSYVDLLNKIAYYGGSITDHTRLFDNEYYSFDPQIDLDKLVNYSQYYWVSSGIQPIEVSSGGEISSNVITLTRNLNNYSSSQLGTEANPTIYITRNQPYTIICDHSTLGSTWIQSEPGQFGIKYYTPGASSRDVLGVTNNGQSSGNITINIPSTDAQNHLLEYTVGQEIDYAIHLSTLTSLDNLTWTESPITLISGQIFVPDEKYVIFTNPSSNSADWVDRNNNIVPVSQRNGIWKMTLVTGAGDVNKINLTFIRNLEPKTKAVVLNGVKQGVEYYIDDNDNVIEFPNITAPLNTLYYQSDRDSSLIGKIEIIDVPYSINVLTDIIGKTEYTSPGGVVFSNGLTVKFDSSVTPETYSNKTFIVEGCGSGIKLINIDNLANHEAKINYESVGISLVPEYITINRSSIDGNAWSRSNRWYHIDVITESYKRNNLPLNIDNSQRAKRPIIEFKPDLQLFDHGRVFETIVDYLYDSTTKRNISGVLYSLNDINSQVVNREYADLEREGITFKAGNKIIFANDISANVRRRIYKASYVNQTVQTATSTFHGFINGGISCFTTSSIVNGYETQFHTDLRVGYDLFTLVGLVVTYVGRVSKIISNTQLQLEQRSNQTLARATGVKYLRPRINLIEESVCLTYHSVPVKFGKNQDLTWWLDDRNSIAKWNKGQNKTTVNQEPLFDIVDKNDVSFGDKTIYPGSDFHGCKIFSYKPGSTPVDPVLGVRISYTGTTNFIGDINFINNYETDKFKHRLSLNSIVVENRTERKINSGFIRRIISIKDTDHEKINTWIPVGNLIKKPVLGAKLSTNTVTARGFYAAEIIDDAFVAYLGRHADQTTLDSLALSYSTYQLTIEQIEKIIATSVEARVYNPYQLEVEHSSQYYHFTGTYDGLTNYFDIGAMPKVESSFKSRRKNLLVYVNNQQLAKITPLLTNAFEYELVSGVRHCIKIDYTLLKTGDKIDIFFKSDQVSNLANFTIPENLEFNALNGNVFEMSLGQIRNHLAKIGSNITGLSGNILSRSNIRDLDYSHRNGSILQHSSSIPYAAAFLTHQDANFIHSLDYARREYTRFKNKFLELGSTLIEVTDQDIPGSVDIILEKLNLSKNETFAFYYSDMFAYGSKFETIQFRVSNSSTRIYPLGSFGAVVDKPSNNAILIYVNNNQLVINRDYRFIDNTVEILASFSLSINDILNIKIYSSTDGCYVPETPTKLGLFPKFIPSKFLDTTYRQDINVIQGHDGSLMPAFDDIRDDLLLELEKRIYNNIKVQYNPAIFDIRKYIPGKFRTTDYSLSEFNQIVTADFLKWVGDSKLNYSKNDTFLGNDEFSYNYNRCIDFDDERLPGYWRGIYKFYYDTDRPHSHPWEMLGFTIKPDWWDTYYSWTDSVKRSALILAITDGIISSPSATSLERDSKFSRPGFSGIVPVDNTGQLLSPLALLVRNFNSSSFSRSYGIGDHGPVETAWRRSSEYPFALQRAMALMKPAQYFGLLFDVSRYSKIFYSSEPQYAEISSFKRITNKEIVINGNNVDNNVTRASGYLNWIHGYLTNQGIDAGSRLQTVLTNIEVNLAYKMAGFTDKKYLNVFAEQFSPNSVNESVVLPEENYNIHLNKSVPINRIVYSAVIVEKTNQGWSVSGYDTKYPFFTVIPSEINTNVYGLSVLGKGVTIYKDFRNEKLIIPYGYEFTTIQQVTDFLVSYQRFLRAQGFRFNEFDNTLGVQRDWILSVSEFLTWTLQGWKEGSVIVLSPVIDSLTVFNTNGIVDEITNRVYDSRLLGVNFKTINRSEFTIIRDNNVTNIFTISGQTIALADFNIVQYEHVLIFDNKTVFNDILYFPELGNRQYRIRMVGSKTNNWDGELTPNGFIYVDSSMPVWSPLIDYDKGDIVRFKDKNYTSLQKQEASVFFNFNYWSQVDLELENGLAANFAQIAQQFENIYDVDNQPLNENIAKFSNSLIGYRSRPYLTDLGMNETTQVKFYQGYIREKGTKSSIEALGKGHFEDINSELTFYEEWAARVGEYGAIDSNPEIRVILKESIYNDNPITLEFLDFGESPTDRAATGIFPNQLYTRTSDYNKKIFLNRDESNIYDSSSLTTYKIELFGDSIICGQDPVQLEAFSISATTIAEYNVDVLDNPRPYLIQLTNSFGELVNGSLIKGDKFKLQITSSLNTESLTYVIEEANDNDLPLSSLVLPSSEVQSLVAGQQFLLNISSLNSDEILEYSIEEVLPTDVGGSSISELKLIEYSNVGDSLTFNLSSIAFNEILFYTIETPTEYDKPNAVVYNSSKIACVGGDNVSYRVPEPVDYLLYESLKSLSKIAITTRSVGNSTSTTLLAGNDGANGVWPDNIDADLVIINHGMRDAQAGITLEQYRKNLIELRNKLDKNISVLWFLPGPINTSLKTKTGLPDPRVEWARTNNIDQYAKVMREVALSFGDYHADPRSIPDYQKFLTVDGIHPTQEGYRELVNKVLSPVITEAVKSKRRVAAKNYEDDIISAGYVDKSDVDEILFDLRDFNPISNGIDRLYTGYKLWVAKDLKREWQVYRFSLNQSIVQSVTIDLDNKITFTCSVPHNLKQYDFIVLTGFDEALDGFFQILTNDNLTFTVIASTSQANIVKESDLEDRTGQFFDLQPMRFTSIEARDKAKPKTFWRPDDNIYVDDNGLGEYAVYRAVIDSWANAAVVSSDIGYKNIYTVIARNCGDTDPNNIAVRTVSGESLNFCVTSAFPAELDLYWTVETPLGADPSIPAFLVGNLETSSDRVIIDPNPIYRWIRRDVKENIVDIESINNIYLYSKKSQRILTRLDILDPAKGRILGAALQDIDYTLSFDPAQYRNALTSLNVTPDDNFFWGAEHVGEYWWNIDRCRFLNYETGALRDRINNWGKLFPGSSVEVYEWIESDYLPSVYVDKVANGIPLYPDDSAYSFSTYIDNESNAFKTKYYFWVRGRIIDNLYPKRNSTNSIEQIITNPKEQGIPYLAAIKDNAIALFNCGPYLNGEDTILYLSSKRLINEKIIHTDFALIQEGDENSKIPTRIENKIIDSICGLDINLNPVPDASLPESQRYGFDIRPRQSVIINKTKARENIIRYINRVLIKNPIASKLVDKYQIFSDNMFAKAVPNNSDYSDRVPGFSNLINVIPLNNLRILVEVDETINNNWSIYKLELLETNQTSDIIDSSKYRKDYPFISAYETSSGIYDIYGYSRVKKQSFGVANFWRYHDWFAPGYSRSTIADYVVNNYKDLYKLTLPPGTIVRINNTEEDTISQSSNSIVQIYGSFELIRFREENPIPELVGIGNGTIQLKDDFFVEAGFDSSPFDTQDFDFSVDIELRYILQALKNEIFTNELSGEYNKLIYFIIDYILTEQKYIDWFFKTSFITVKHTINGLVSRPSYIRERQDNYEKYINEVKPYRTKIRQYILNYRHTELSSLDITDFDLPAFYDKDLLKFRSPSGELGYLDNLVLQQPKYLNWAQNYLYGVNSVDIYSPGYGYEGLGNGSSPSIVVSRTDTLSNQPNAVISATVSSIGTGIQSVAIDVPGKYLSTPKISVIGSGGSLSTDVEIHKFTVVARGLFDTTTISGSLRPWGFYDTDSDSLVLWNTAARSYTMHRVRRSDGKVTFSSNYDVWLSASEAARLANDLNATSSDFVVVVHTYNDPKSNRTTNGLDLAMYRCGASASVFGSLSFASAAAYILVGIAGCGQSNGIENYAGLTQFSSVAYCSINFEIRKGNLIPISAYPTIYEIGTAFSLPLSGVVGQVFSYGNKQWQYNGRSWIVYKRPTTKLPFDNPPKQAKLIARLENNTVRKIKTVLKFDRISYTTKVHEWNSANTYVAGTLLSYKGLGYIATTTIRNEPFFNYGKVIEVGSDQDSQSKTYKHGFYDNANDRIMAFYTPSQYNFFVEKDIRLIVPGITGPDSITGNTSLVPDTILISDTFNSNIGIEASNIKIDGGTFLSNIFSHSPEELLPGQTFDSVSIRVLTSTTANVGVRVFKDMSGNLTYTNFIQSNVTFLTNSLLLSSNTIIVDDGSILSIPNKIAGIPGVVMINGERIWYYSVVGNVLGDLRRGVDGTGAPYEHGVGSIVEDAGAPLVRTAANI